MRETKTRYNNLLVSYQRWLSGFTELAIINDMCHLSIQASHHLMAGSLYFPGTGQITTVVPQYLYRLICGNQHPEPVSLVTNMQISLEAKQKTLLHHPMLEGILLSECIRLKQRPLANRLISLLQQFSSPKYRHKLVWLYQYDLMMGVTLEDWLDNLKRKAPENLGLRLAGRQEENISLAQMMNEYLLFTDH